MLVLSKIAVVCTEAYPSNSRAVSQSMVRCPEGLSDRMYTVQSSFLQVLNQTFRHEILHLCYVSPVLVQIPRTRNAFVQISKIKIYKHVDMISRRACRTSFGSDVVARQEPRD